MEATAPLHAGDDTTPPGVEPAPRPSLRDRLAWAFPIGCAIVAAATYGYTRFTAVTPEAEVPNYYAASNFWGQHDPIGEQHEIALPFITTDVITTDYFALPSAHPKATITMGQLAVSGRLPPALVERALRYHRPKVRRCYERGLKDNPKLTGRVTTRFVIGRDGRVSAAGNGGSDLPDGRVIACVAGTLSGLLFDAPQGGVATIVYPLIFSPG